MQSIRATPFLAPISQHATKYKNDINWPTPIPNILYRANQKFHAKRGSFQSSHQCGTHLIAYTDESPCYEMACTKYIYKNVTYTMMAPSNWAWWATSTTNRLTQIDAHTHTHTPKVILAAYTKYENTKKATKKKFSIFVSVRPNTQQRVIYFCGRWPHSRTMHFNNEKKNCYFFVETF